MSVGVLGLDQFSKRSWNVNCGGICRVTSLFFIKVLCNSYISKVDLCQHIIRDAAEAT